jgi:hypothetical protein
VYELTAPPPVCASIRDNYFLIIGTFILSTSSTRRLLHEQGVLSLLLVTQYICDHKSCAACDTNSLFTLYVYPDPDRPALFDAGGSGLRVRRPNLSESFMTAMKLRLGLHFVADGRGDLRQTVDREEMFHYMYAVFYHPTYRSRYSVFLQIDFSRLPIPRQAVVSLVEEPMTDRVDAGWSVREFDGLDLGDARLNRRLLTLAEAFGAYPQAPINQASADWQSTKAAYAFFAHPHALPAEILLPHQQRTLERMAAHPLVLAIQDTCLLNYTHHPATTSLGPIGGGATWLGDPFDTGCHAAGLAAQCARPADVGSS